MMTAARTCRATSVTAEPASSGSGDRRHARQGGQRHGRLDEPAAGRAAPPVQAGEEQAAEDGAEEGHLGEAEEGDHLALDLERHAGGVGRCGSCGGDGGGHEAGDDRGAPQRGGGAVLVLTGASVMLGVMVDMASSPRGSGGPR